MLASWESVSITASSSATEAAFKFKADEKRAEDDKENSSFSSSSTIDMFSKNMVK